MSVDLIFQCATSLEFEALRQAFRAQEITREGKRQFFTMGSVVVLKAGLGKALAAAGAEFAISRWKPALVVDFGTCGALGLGLKVGDIILANKVIEHDHFPVRGRVISLAPFGLSTFAGEIPEYPEFLEVSEEARITRGAIAAGDKDIESVVDRTEMAKNHSAIAATWESSAIARICELHGVSFACLRVVSDVGGAPLLEEYQANASRVLGTALKYLLQKLPVRR